MNGGERGKLPTANPSAHPTGGHPAPPRSPRQIVDHARRNVVRDMERADGLIQSAVVVILKTRLASEIRERRLSSILENVSLNNNCSPL